MPKEKRCPYCFEVIDIDASSCKHCGEILNKNIVIKRFNPFLLSIFIISLCLTVIAIFASSTGFDCLTGFYYSCIFQHNGMDMFIVWQNVQNTLYPLLLPIIATIIGTVTIFDYYKGVGLIKRSFLAFVSTSIITVTTFLFTDAIKTFVIKVLAMKTLDFNTFWDLFRVAIFVVILCSLTWIFKKFRFKLH